MALLLLHCGSAKFYMPSNAKLGFSHSFFDGAQSSLLYDGISTAASEICGWKWMLLLKCKFF